MKLSELKPQDIVYAYEKTGMKPIRNEWLKRESDGTFCACGLTALACSIGVEPEHIEKRIGKSSIIREELNISYDEMEKFVEGFDGGMRHKDDPVYKLGEETAKLIFGEEIENEE